MKKRLLLVTLIALLSLLWYGALAEGGVLRLPASLVIIEENAFEGIAAEAIVLPDGVEEIGNHAFASTSLLRLVWIPKSVHSIGDGAFGNRMEVTFFGESGSFGHNWARQQGKRFIPLDILAVITNLVAITVVAWLLGTALEKNKEILCSYLRNVGRGLNRKQWPEMYPLAWDFP